MIIFFILIVGFFSVTIYFILKEEPVVNEIVYRDILVNAIDHETQKPIIVNFTILGNGTFLAGGETRTDSLVKVSVPSNYPVVYISPDHPDYYHDTFLVSGNKHILDISKIGDISVSHSGDIHKGSGTINLNITTNRENREISACFRWSTNILEVTHSFYPLVKELNTKLDCQYEGYVWIEPIEDCGFFCKIGISDPNITEGKCNVESVNILPPSRLNGKVDRCYYIKQALKKDLPFQLTIHYRAYDVNDNDFITVYILDSDLRNGKYVFEDANGKDVGAEDILYTIRNK